MTPPAVEVVSEKEIAEVKAFLAAQKELQAFLDQHPSLMGKLRHLAGVYNATLAAGHTAVRSYPPSAPRGRPVASGPYDLYQWERRDDARILLDLVGRQRFASFGGIIEPIEKLTLDRSRFDAAVVREKIALDAVATVVQWAPRYHEPKELRIP